MSNDKNPISDLAKKEIHVLDSRSEEGMLSIMAIEMEMRVILGTARLPVNQILELASGSVVELDRRFGQLLDVEIGGRRVARGEIVRIDETGGLGIKMTEITKEYLPKSA